MTALTASMDVVVEYASASATILLTVVGQFTLRNEPVLTEGTALYVQTANPYHTVTVDR